MKKIIALILALSAVWVLVACASLGEDIYNTPSLQGSTGTFDALGTNNGESGDLSQESEPTSDGGELKYRLNDTKDAYTVVGIGECGEGEIVIPNEHEGLPVTAIGDSAFYECTRLTSVNIPDSVTEIGYSAFWDCTGLTSLKIQGGVLEIGNWSFAGCTALADITIPEGVNKIGTGAFAGCRKLTSVTLPNSLTSLGSRCFYDCTRLSNITLRGNIVKIGSWSFADCTALEGITIPESVCDIGQGAFAGCTGVKSITVEGENPTFHSAGDCLINTKEKILVAGCKKSVIPSDGSVIKIGEDAFSGCIELKEINISEAVREIGDFAFGGCAGLVSINIPSGVTKVGEDCFAWCRGLTSVTIWQSVVEIGKKAFEECEALKDIFYEGNEREWARLFANVSLPDAVTLHFNFK